jgi:nucleoside-diphosphate-sugar epimerase
VPNILVIGGTGFIGSHLLKRVIKEGWSATSISLHAPTERRFIDSVNYIQANLDNEKEIMSCLCNGFDYVVNLGGYIDHKNFNDGGRDLIDSHFIGVMNLVQSLPKDKLKCFVQIGSSDEYGNAVSPQKETIREQSISPYSFSKMAATHFLQMLNQTENFPCIILRLFLTYGPEQDIKRFLPQIIIGCLHGRTFPVSEGKQLRDFCYIDDVVDAILCTLNARNAIGEVINIASGQPVSIRSMVNRIQKRIGKGEPLYGAIPYRVGENMELYASIGKARHLLGWSPNITLEEGINKTVAWYERE